MDVKVAEYQFGVETIRQVDGVFDDYQSFVRTKEQFSFLSTDTCRCTEFVCWKPLFLSP